MKKTADFMYASLASSNCLLQWYVASLLAVQQLAKKSCKGRGQINSAGVPACNHFLLEENLNGIEIDLILAHLYFVGQLTSSNSCVQASISFVCCLIGGPECALDSGCSCDHTCYDRGSPSYQ